MSGAQVSKLAIYQCFVSVLKEISEEKHVVYLSVRLVVFYLL